MICSSAFWKQKCENLKNISQTFFFVLARGTNRLFYCTGVMTYNKFDNYFVDSADKQTFLGFETTVNLRNTSLLSSFQFIFKVCHTDAMSCPWH